MSAEQRDTPTALNHLSPREKEDVIKIYGEKGHGLSEEQINEAVRGLEGLYSERTKNFYFNLVRSEIERAWPGLRKPTVIELDKPPAITPQAETPKRERRVRQIFRRLISRQTP